MHSDGSRRLPLRFCWSSHPRSMKVLNHESKQFHAYDSRPGTASCMRSSATCSSSTSRSVREFSFCADWLSVSLSFRLTNHLFFYRPSGGPVKLLHGTNWESEFDDSLIWYCRNNKRTYIIPVSCHIWAVIMVKQALAGNVICQDIL